MPFSEIASRADVAMDPDADFQTWIGIASDGNRLRYARMRSGQRRAWCRIDQSTTFSRLTQGLSFLGHLPAAGELVLSTNQNPGQPFRVDFDPAISGVGLDIEPMPMNVVPGAPWRARLQLLTAAGQHDIVKTATVGQSLWIGGRSDLDPIATMIVHAEMIGPGGGPVAVDFGTNRLELLVPVGLIV